MYVVSAELEIEIDTDVALGGSEDSTYFSVYLTGTKNKVDNAASDSSSSSSSSSSTSTTSSSPSVVTMEGLYP